MLIANCSVGIPAHEQLQAIETHLSLHSSWAGMPTLQGQKNG